MAKKFSKSRARLVSISGVIALLTFVLGSAGGISGTASANEGHEPGKPRSGWDFEAFEQVPVLSGGRVKPLDTYASEGLLFITGRQSRSGWTSVDVLLSILAFPNHWHDQKIFRIQDVEVRNQLLIEGSQTEFSYNDLLRINVFLQYAEAQSGLRQTTKQGTRQTAREKELARLVSGFLLYRAIIDGRAWAIVPQNPPAAWESLARVSDPNAPTADAETLAIQNAFKKTVRSYLEGQRADFEKASVELKTAVENAMRAHGMEVPATIAAEHHYNRLAPFQKTWILYLLAALLWSAMIWLGEKAPRYLKPLAWVVSLGGFFMHTYGFGLRIYIAGRPPVSNMYESVVWVAWGVLVFAFVIYFFQRHWILLASGFAIACLGMLAADFSPAVMDPSINPLVPVLRSNLWLIVHVLTITISYAAFALALGIGNYTLWQFARRYLSGAMSEKGRKLHTQILELNQLMYRAIQFGVVLLAAGTILGGVWADFSWGRFWGWDPKEVWALISLLAYLAILHGRYAGWVSQFGFAAWSVVSFMCVVMAWYGVNFVLGVGLHTYGVSSGGFGGVIAYVGLQLAFLGWVAFLHRKHLASTRALSSSGKGVPA